MRVLVCGSRTFADGDLLRQVLDGLFYRRALGSDWRVLHGAGRGADMLADGWARGAGLVVERYTADWDRDGKAAGVIRNRHMLNEGKPDLVVAFIDKPLEESRGTCDMVRLARQAGVRTVVVECWPPASTQGNLLDPTTT